MNIHVACSLYASRGLHPEDSYFSICLHEDLQEATGAPGIATRSKDATRGSWPYY